MQYGNVELHNVWNIAEREEGGGVRMCRFPLKILPAINRGAQMRSFAGAGCEIRGLLPPGGKGRIVLERTNENVVPAIAETFFGCFLDSSVALGDGPTEIMIEEPRHMPVMHEICQRNHLPFAANLVRVRLPHLHDIVIHVIDGDLIYPDVESTPGTTMLAYGSSITHGAQALRPSGTYASQAARTLGCDLLNLGVGGSAHMDAAVAEHIAARTDWDFATLEMGINVGNWDADRFRKAVENFVGEIHTAQPEKPLFCMDVFTFRGDFVETPDHGGVQFRGIVRDIVAAQNSDKVIYVDGRTILTNPAGLRPDLVHPGDDGMTEMGRNLAETIKTSGAIST